MPLNITLKFAKVLCLLTLCSPSLAEPLEAFQDCPDCPVMIELPVGTFILGASDDEFRQNLVFTDDYIGPATEEHPFQPWGEGPQREVTIDLPFAMSRDEITIAQWMACVEGGGCNGYVPSNRAYEFGVSTVPEIADVDGPYYLTAPDHPVTHVSLEDAQSYVDWLNTTLGTTAYALPTEVEWEYAARAGTTTPFAQGHDLTTDQANFSRQMTENVMLQPLPDLEEYTVPLQVSALDAANAWGLRHMSGNVAEWTVTCYQREHPDWQLSSVWRQTIDPNCAEYVIRGGGYRSAVPTLRVAARKSRGPDTRNTAIGFRVIMFITE